MLPLAILFITLALAFYTVGVWAEKMRRTLLKWHVAVFWLGFVCDTVGTTLMSRMAGDAVWPSGLNFHAVTGALAILLMLFHAIWATAVIVRGQDKAKASFHKFSVAVWCIWLVPYISGMIMGMRS